MQFAPVLGRRMRLVQLSDTGDIPTTTPAQVVTNGYITVNLTSEVEEGVEITTRKADGTICVNEKLAPSFKWFNLEVELCGVDPAVLGISTVAEIYENYADQGEGIVVPEGTIDKKFALEIWTGLSGRLADASANGYFLLPLVQGGTLGDITIDGENAVNATISGAYTRGGNKWGTGPFNVLQDTDGPAQLPTPLDPLDHLLIVPTTVQAPEVTEGLVPVTP